MFGFRDRCDRKWRFSRKETRQSIRFGNNGRWRLVAENLCLFLRFVCTENISENVIFLSLSAKTKMLLYDDVWRVYSINKFITSCLLSASFCSFDSCSVHVADSIHSLREWETICKLDNNYGINLKPVNWWFISVPPNVIICVKVHSMKRFSNLVRRI